MRKGIVLVAILGLGAAGAWWRWGREEPPPAWRTVAVERDDVRQVVSATGTLEAVQTVEVGAQVSGIIAALGADFNDRVEKGQVLARIDPALLEADVAAAAARLAEERATAGRLAVELRRIEELHGRRITTDSELDAARAEHAVAQAQLTSAQVALDRARRNLGYATISAPISGTVIRRDVEVGQTVNAGLSAPKLFLLAGDLSRMRILAAVDESDIGLIREGQRATFTVQAYPDRVFSGTVDQVRLQSSTAESVVTYTVVVDVANPDGRLLPGMTATVEFVVAEADDAVCVSSAALRYRPDETVPIVGADGTVAADVSGARGPGRGAGNGAAGPANGADGVGAVATDPANGAAAAAASADPAAATMAAAEADAADAAAADAAKAAEQATDDPAAAAASSGGTPTADGASAGGASSASSAPSATGTPGAGAPGAGAGRRGRRGGGPSDEGTLWLPEGAALRPLPVKIGLRGASCVVVSGEGVEEGLVVVTGVDRSESGGTASPFGTPGGQKRRPGGF